MAPANTYFGACVIITNKITTKMASASSKIATDSQGKPSIQANNLPPDEDDDENIDLGAASPSQTSLKDSKQGFEMINLDADEEDEYDFESSLPDKRRKRYRKKKKKKEELCDSSSDDESTKSRSKNEEVNPSDLTWPLYLWYYIVAVSTGALRAAEYLGEKLAYFFGITSPKYQYVIDEFYRQKELEKEEEEREEREREYVARMEAERIASLEGGDNAQATLTIPDDPSIQSPTKT